MANFDVKWSGNKDRGKKQLQSLVEWKSEHHNEDSNNTRKT